MPLDFTIIAAANNEEVLTTNLLASPCLPADPERTIIMRGAVSASRAYNAGLARTKTPVAVLVHQDVYLPAGWENKLERAIVELDVRDQRWAVLGIFGMSADGRHLGRTWSSGIGADIGETLQQPAPAVSLDELLLVLRTDAGMRFDEALPGFHLYGTDIVQTALAAGKSAYVFNGPVIHNSLPVGRLKQDYAAAYDYMRRKWRSGLPIPTSVLPLTRSGWPLRRHWLLAIKHRLTRRADCPERSTGRRHPNPGELARKLNYELPDQARVSLAVKGMP